MKKIYRTYADTEVAELATQIECPHCNREWLEHGMDEPGQTYTITCGDEWDDGCGKTFEMYFDAS